MATPNLVGISIRAETYCRRPREGVRGGAALPLGLQPAPSGKP